MLQTYYMVVTDELQKNVYGDFDGISHLFIAYYFTIMNL